MGLALTGLSGVSYCGVPTPPPGPPPALSLVSAEIPANGATINTGWSPDGVVLANDPSNIFASYDAGNFNAVSVTGSYNPVQIAFEGPGAFVSGVTVYISIAVGTFQVIGDPTNFNVPYEFYEVVNNSLSPALIDAQVNTDGISGTATYNKTLDPFYGVTAAITVTAHGVDMTAYITSVSGSTIEFSIAGGDAVYNTDSPTVTIPSGVLVSTDSLTAVQQTVNATNYSEVPPPEVVNYFYTANDSLSTLYFDLIDAGDSSVVIANLPLTWASSFNWNSGAIDYAIPGFSSNTALIEITYPDATTLTLNLNDGASPQVIIGFAAAYDTLPFTAPSLFSAGAYTYTAVFKLSPS